MALAGSNKKGLCIEVPVEKHSTPVVIVAEAVYYPVPRGSRKDTSPMTRDRIWIHRAKLSQVVSMTRKSSHLQIDNESSYTGLGGV